LRYVSAILDHPIFSSSRRRNTIEEQLKHLEQKRRHYSWQQAEGIITDEELRTAFKQIQSEESVIKEQMNRLEQFRREPAPMDMANFKKLAEFWPHEIMSNLHDAPDDVRARFAEMFELYATVRPDGSRDGYHVDLSANIPLEMEGDKPGAYDMVFGSSASLFHEVTRERRFITQTGRYTWRRPAVF
jgi:hypothetical protein